MTEEIWVVADHGGGELNEVTLEILGEARDLARRLTGKVCAVLLGHKVQEDVEILVRYGADKVYLAEHELLAHYVTDIYTKALAGLALQRQPSIIIFGATANGSDLAIRLAAQLRAPIATDCIKLEVNEDSALIATRPSYGDQVYITLAFAGNKPHIATMRPGVIGTAQQDPSRTAEVVTIEPAIDPRAARTELRRRFKPDPATLHLTEAEMIVAGGGGASTKEHWSLIQDFAHNLGASVGGSRVAADFGFISAERVIGQSGVYVAPRLYIGIGISGATHHTQGIKGAKLIIAINKDRAAPIFNIADLKVISDLDQLLPKLNEEIRRVGATLSERRRTDL
jgi:electron transfer flavoprotein alpha subunit